MDCINDNSIKIALVAISKEPLIVCVEAFHDRTIWNRDSDIPYFRFCSRFWINLRL